MLYEECVTWAWLEPDTRSWNVITRADSFGKESPSPDRRAYDP